MGARMFPRVEIRPKEVEVPDLYFAFVRLAVMAAGAGVVLIFVR